MSPIVVEVYEFHEFHGKLEKVEKGKGLNHRKEESNKKGCVGRFTERLLLRTQLRHLQNPEEYLRWSLLRTWLIIFAKSFPS